MFINMYAKAQRLKGGSGETNQLLCSRMGICKMFLSVIILVLFY